MAFYLWRLVALLINWASGLVLPPFVLTLVFALPPRLSPRGLVVGNGTLAAVGGGPPAFNRFIGDDAWANGEGDFPDGVPPRNNANACLATSGEILFVPGLGVPNSGAPCNICAIGSAWIGAPSGPSIGIPSGPNSG